MVDSQNRRIVLANLPTGLPKTGDFRLEETPIPAPGANQVLIGVRYLSLDPYMRGVMSGAECYIRPTVLGGVIEGGTVGVVLLSNHTNFQEGDWVLSHSGWQTHDVAGAEELRKLDPTAAPVTTALGILGMPGFTAYSGLLTIGEPKPGQTVAVAAATGPVGSAVGQIAKIRGARTIGIAGGPTKVAYVKELGFDAALDHMAPDFGEQLAKACPSGIDIYFENVGGHVWDAVFPLLNTFARVVVCGLIAQYNDGGPFPGPDRLPLVMREVLSKRFRIQGLAEGDFADQRPAFFNTMGGWIREGKIKYREDIVDGLANAPEAFIGMLQGRNFGKLLVRVA